MTNNDFFGKISAYLKHTGVRCILGSTFQSSHVILTKISPFMTSHNVFEECAPFVTSVQISECDHLGIAQNV